VLARVRADRLIFSPGEGWAYSNVGYLFVRQLIEETVDMEIDKALRVLVFEPMGIQRTRIAKTPDDMAQTRRLTGAIQMATIRGGFIMAS
jgi:CubicO group peptidase (beta-lactamase class C family)